MRLLIILLLLFVSTKTLAENNCKWDDDIPCITIYPKLNNSNALGDKITPTTTITKTEIREHNLIDLPRVLDYVATLDVTQSGPTGQNGSIFLRGTNSNHTLITLNGIAIKDHSTPGGSDDLSQHSFLGVERIEVIKGPMGSLYGANSIGGTINMITYPTDENSISVSTGSNNTNTQTIKLGKVIENTLIDLRIENETSDGISVVNGDEKDSLKNRNYIFQK